MGADDDSGCEHVWRLVGVTLAADGATSEYGCAACEAVLLLAPGDDHPEG